jgi:enamine deaminase RidA (YjgF/YER057c/UK114 family)
MKYSAKLCHNMVCINAYVVHHCLQYSNRCVNNLRKSRRELLLSVSEEYLSTMFTTRATTVRHLANGASRRFVRVEARIVELGYILPPLPPAPQGNYMTYTRSGNMLYLAGHLPIPPPIGGKAQPMLVGRLGENYTIPEGQAAARTAGLQILATIKAAVGDLDKVKKVVKLVGFVNSTNDFSSQAQVMNGCSDLMGDVFGVEIGRHARSSLGANILPFGVPVEIEAIIEVSE